MTPLLRLFYFSLFVLLPFGSQANSVIVSQGAGDEAFLLVSDAAEHAHITVPYTTLDQETDLQEPREETQEEEEEPTDLTITSAFQYPLVDFRPEWNAFVFHPCGPQLFKRYLHFHALKLFC